MCFVEHSIRRAKTATLVVANHALVMVQAALGGGEDGKPLRYVFDATEEHTGIPSLLRELSARDIAFKDLETSKSSLEDIFVDRLVNRLRIDHLLQFGDDRSLGVVMGLGTRRNRLEPGRGT